MTDLDMTGLVGPAFAESLPGHIRLLLLTDGKRISQVVHVLATLRVADHLASGPASAADLARLTETDEDALGRVLRVACSFGLFDADDEGCFSLNSLSQ